MEIIHFFILFKNSSIHHCFLFILLQITIELIQNVTTSSETLTNHRHMTYRIFFFQSFLLNLLSIHLLQHIHTRFDHFMRCISRFFLRHSIQNGEYIHHLIANRPINMSINRININSSLTPSCFFLFFFVLPFLEGVNRPLDGVPDNQYYLPTVLL